MKKVLMMSALFISALTFGQLEKGSEFVSGSAGFSSQGGEFDNGTSTTDSPTYSTFNVSPAGGYFVADGLAVGLSLGFSGTKWNDDANDSKSKTSSFGLSVFAKKYKSIADKFYLFGQANVGFGSGKSETENNGTTVDGPKTNSIFFGLAPGAEYFFSEHISMSCSVGALSFISSTETEEVGGTEQKDKDTQFDFNLDLSAVNFGFTYYFK
jgi:hypothetical protein